RSCKGSIGWSSSIACEAASGRSHFWPKPSARTFRRTFAVKAGTSCTSPSSKASLTARWRRSNPGCRARKTARRKSSHTRIVLMLTRLSLIGILCLGVAVAQKYSGPRPTKTDVPYLLHADNLVETEVTEAKEEKRKDDLAYIVPGANSSARTPLAG